MMQNVLGSYFDKTPMILVYVYPGKLLKPLELERATLGLTIDRKSEPTCTWDVPSTVQIQYLDSFP
jgi:hypothetical protein